MTSLAPPLGSPPPGPPRRPPTPPPGLYSLFGTFMVMMLPIRPWYHNGQTARSTSTMRPSTSA